MTLSQLLPSVQELPHADKLQLMQWLATQLANEEGVALLSSEETYPIWSPHDSYEAAAVLSSHNAFEVSRREV